MLAIVSGPGPNRVPIYVTELNKSKASSASSSSSIPSPFNGSTTTTTTTTTSTTHFNDRHYHDERHFNELVLHASLDMVESKRWKSRDLYLGVVDTFNDLLVSAWITSPGDAVFLLLHAQRNRARSDNNIKNFFQELNDVFLPLSMNPFREANDTPIPKPSAFDSKVHELIRRHHMDAM